ncbi:alkaline phosphatase D family protein [Nocardioides sp.]|uniref:alkaline phosphatase D family protein n=1 Tax=Nocardioides sp. TaxID=35761 RepID=UPI002D802E1A|nr:alkaline phosphatase D family protein [Nocardioides sp.]HET8960485.1 alkaline phosphatase D family protein [Nocardioides sp.]
MTGLDRRALLRGGLGVGAGALASGAVVPPVLGAGTKGSPALLRSGRPGLTHGVQSGDVTARTATVWARADRASRLLVEVSRDPAFRNPRRLAGPVVSSATDFTGKVQLRGLPAASELHYRIRPVDPDDAGTDGEPLVGRLRTAPLSRRDISFVWSGDIAGQGWGVNPDLGGFPMADALLSMDPDFFLCSGDTVYADGPVQREVLLPNGQTWRNIVTEEKTKVAETLAEFRGQYKYNLLADNWRRFLARTPQVNQWDDHEVTNNWYPGEVLDDDRYTVKEVDVLAARASRAFHEYQPIAPARRDSAGRIYRVLRYGPLLDVFVLDMRSCKDPNTSNREPVADGGVLGREQTAWLERELGASRAVWKVIAADLPIGLVVGDGATAFEGIANADPGRPLGRELDLAQVLSFLKRQGIRNHVWLTADVHYTAAHHYSPERAAFTDFDPFWEFVSGPLNAGGFGPAALDATFGPTAVFSETPPRPNTSPAEGHQYVGEVAIDGDTGQLTVRLRGIDGSIRWSTTLDPHAR